MGPLPNTVSSLPMSGQPISSAALTTLLLVASAVGGGDRPMGSMPTSAAKTAGGSNHQLDTMDADRQVRESSHTSASTYGSESADAEKASGRLWPSHSAMPEAP
eukprot:3531694-Prymnesium_polylepis.1